MLCCSLSYYSHFPYKIFLMLQVRFAKLLYIFMWSHDHDFIMYSSVFCIFWIMCTLHNTNLQHFSVKRIALNIMRLWLNRFNKITAFFVEWWFDERSFFFLHLIFSIVYYMRWLEFAFTYIPYTIYVLYIEDSRQLWIRYRIYTLIRFQRWHWNS